MLDISDLTKNLSGMVDLFKNLKQQGLSDDEIEVVLEIAIKNIKSEVTPFKEALISCINDSDDSDDSNDFSELQKQSIKLMLIQASDEQSRTFEESKKSMDVFKSLIHAAAKDLNDDRFLSFMRKIVQEIIDVLPILLTSKYEFKVARYIVENPDALI